MGRTEVTTQLFCQNRSSVFYGTFVDNRPLQNGLKLHKGLKKDAGKSSLWVLFLIYDHTDSCKQKCSPNTKSSVNQFKLFLLFLGCKEWHSQLKGEKQKSIFNLFRFKVTIKPWGFPLKARASPSLKLPVLFADPIVCGSKISWFLTTL